MPLSAPDAAGAPEFPADPAAYAVRIIRATGREVTRVEVVVAASGEMFAAYDHQVHDDDAAEILRRAEAFERHDPHAGKLPSDRAIILAAMEDCGIEPSDA